MTGSEYKLTPAERATKEASYITVGMLEKRRAGRAPADETAKFWETLEVAIFNRLNSRIPKFLPTPEQAQMLEGLLRTSTLSSSKQDAALAAMNLAEWTREQFYHFLQEAKDNQKPDDRIASKLGSKKTPQGFQAHKELQEKIERDTTHEN